MWCVKKTKQNKTLELLLLKKDDFHAVIKLLSFCCYWYIFLGGHFLSAKCHQNLLMVFQMFSVPECDGVAFVSSVGRALTRMNTACSPSALINSRLSNVEDRVGGLRSPSPSCGQPRLGQRSPPLHNATSDPSDPASDVPPPIPAADQSPPLPSPVSAAGQTLTRLNLSGGELINRWRLMATRLQTS